MERQFTDDEIRAIIIARKKAEREAKNRDRLLTIKTIFAIASLFAFAFCVWGGSWIAYAFMN